MSHVNEHVLQDGIVAYEQSNFKTAGLRHMNGNVKIVEN